MKAEQLRNATLLIEMYDQVSTDIKALEACNSELLLRVAIGKGLAYKPSRTHYLAFLKERRTAIEKALKLLGVECE